MPPRYAYWTILVDNQPTAFRAGSQEELLPTFKRLQAKHADARMMWWQNGKLWPSRIDAQEAMRERGERGRQGDFRQTQKDRRDGKLEWQPKGTGQPRNPRPKTQDPRPPRSERAPIEWRPKGAGTPPREKPEWRPKETFKSDRPARADWKSKPRADRPRSFAKPDWKPKGFKSDRPAKPEWRSKSRDDRPRRSGKLDWKPKGSGTAHDSRPKTQDRAKPPGERRDSKWRPGGEHRDPRQKYKDAKKAKWGRFKQAIRKRWESKQGGKPPRPKKKDED